MLRRGFTLIELLIVITIIAILAGAAIPYVADYVEQSKIARCKVDMIRVRDALTRWELDRAIWPVAETSPAKLVGPYLQKAAVDPFGQPYSINSYQSIIYSWGPNQSNDNGAGDDIVLSFRPRMAATKVQWIDTTGDGTIDIGDSIVVSCTRPVLNTLAAGDGDQIVIGGGDDLAAICTTNVTADGRKAVFEIDVAPAATTVPGAGVVITAATAASGAGSSVNDQTSDVANPAGTAWAATQALKADADLILQSE